MTELLPCPMCGTAAHFFKIDDIDQKDFGGQGICCQTEGCVQIGLMFACMDDPKPTLAEKWNRRAPTQGADARPVAIYQVHMNGSGTWLDITQREHEDNVARGIKSRIVYATRDAAPNINEQRYLWLREQHWNESNVAVVLAPKKAVKLGYDCPSGQRLDEIIDAARSAIVPREKT